ncbi:hypothetical protein ACJX0J_011068, partial [Zea mays]
MTCIRARTYQLSILKLGVSLKNKNKNNILFASPVLREIGGPINAGRGALPTAPACLAALDVCKKANNIGWTEIGVAKM